MHTTGITSISASTEVREVSGSATTRPRPSTSTKAGTARSGLCAAICAMPQTAAVDATTLNSSALLIDLLPTSMTTARSGDQIGKPVA